MKRVLSVFLTVLLLAACLCPTALAAGGAYEGKTVILYTGSIRGDVDLYAQIAQVEKSYAAKGAQVLLVDAGNYLQGTAAANSDRGLSIYNLMEAAGYDVAAMGLAEFSYTDATTGYPYHGNVTKYYTQAQLRFGCEEIRYNVGRDGSEEATLPAKQSAGFETVSSNAKSDKGVYAFAQSTEFIMPSGLKIGFYGITDTAAARNVQTGYLTVTRPEPQALPDSEITVCLSNAGLPADWDCDILIDVPDGAFQIGAYVIDNETKEITHETVKLGASDPTVAALAAEAKKNASPVVGKSEVILNGADAQSRNRETNLGDLTCDALLWYAEHYIDGIDTAYPLVALQNGGNCDNFVYTGEITETDLLRALPFSPMGVGVLQVTGAQLLETLEAASQCENSAGFAQVAGLTYTIDRTKPYDAGAAYGKFFEADSINRVTITSVNGQSFDENAIYNLVCDNYLFGGNDTYYTLKAAKEAEGANYINNGNGVKTRDIVAMYLDKQLGGVIGEAYAAPQGRITVRSYTDVVPGSWCAQPVDWAVETGVTNGTSKTTFTPTRDCTFAEIITFVYRALGEPETAAQMRYENVAAESYYYDAAKLAGAENWLDDADAKTFPASQPCTRRDVAELLWTIAGKPVPAGTDNPFTDISAEDTAILWAVEAGITNGTSKTTFSPDKVCNRGEIVTFLYRYFTK